VLFARPIIPGDKRSLNKRIVEALANQYYWLELDNAPGQRVWAFRKAAWAIVDLPVLAGQARGTRLGADLSNLTKSWAGVYWNQYHSPGACGLCADAWLAIGNPRFAVSDLVERFTEQATRVCCRHVRNRWCAAQQRASAGLLRPPERVSPSFGRSSGRC